ncbi:hypothetical protein F5878DRAFT_632785 [Lentinula raphanica]|uniref:Uncharacterized protein n=1 Tax=Lentinula raphanica TaxID=153919 RepID=A0AA38NZL5_9AGAR|nr:hypothetical protein F5878DRAFT_632785 [Lentinula raphanica]
MTGTSSQFTFSGTTRYIILGSAAGLGILAALALSAFVFCRSRSRRLGSCKGGFNLNVADDCAGLVDGRSFTSQGTLKSVYDDDKYSKLKPLKLLQCSKDQFNYQEKNDTNASLDYDYCHQHQHHQYHDAALPQHSADRPPSRPPGLLYVSQLRHPRHVSGGLNVQGSPASPRFSSVRRDFSFGSTTSSASTPVSPASDPTIPTSAYILDGIPNLCSPPSTSPKEIVEWIRSDSILSAHDGYVLAREDSLQVGVFSSWFGSPPATGFGSGSGSGSPTQQAHVSSMLSSSTLNKTAYYGAREYRNDFFAGDSRFKGAMRVPSIEHLFSDSERCELGPVEHGTRWGPILYTLDKPLCSCA